MSALKRQFIELAKQSGWSQAEIARRLDISRGGVNGIITGATEPSKALVRLFQFVLQSETSPSPAPILQDTPNPKTNWAKTTNGKFGDLFELLDKMSEEEREDFLDHAKALAEMVSKKSKKSRKPTKY